MTFGPIITRKSKMQGNGTLGCEGYYVIFDGYFNVFDFEEEKRDRQMGVGLLAPAAICKIVLPHLLPED